MLFKDYVQCMFKKFGYMRNSCSQTTLRSHYFLLKSSRYFSEQSWNNVLHHFSLYALTKDFFFFFLITATLNFLPVSLCPITVNDNTRLTLSENKEPIKLLQNKYNVGNKLEQVP